MRISYLAVIALAFGAAHAYQVLGAGFFLYNNVSVGSSSQIVAGVDANSSIRLIVINSSDLAAFSDGYGVNEFYDNVVGSGIYRISIPGGGSYSVVFEALGDTQLAAGAISYPESGGGLVRLDGSYEYNFTTANYSNVNVTVLSSADFQGAPLGIAVAGESFNVSSDSVLEMLNVSMAGGTHSVYLHSTRPEEVFISASARAALVNPLAELSPGGSYAMGVASYGLYNISGTLIPYRVSTTEVVGTANITSMNATAPGFQAYNVSRHGASLQLNVQLWTHYDGGLRVYWLQDVADFNESSDSMYFEDNMWNDTLPSANMSGATLDGSGNVTGCQSCNQTFYAYSYPYFGINYTLPFNVKLLVFENQTPQGTSVSFGYQVLRDGRMAMQPQVTYDTVVIPGTYNSTILVTPYLTTPPEGSAPGDNYDAELVFAGEANGAESQFTSLNATMWIYYLDGGRVVPFPSAYTFGLNTAESASGVDVVPGGYGAVATVGSPKYSRDVVVSNASAVFAQYLANASRYTSPPTTVPPSLAASGYGQAASLQQVAPYLLVLAIGILVLMMLRIAVRKLLG